MVAPPPRPVLSSAGRKILIIMAFSLRGFKLCQAAKHSSFQGFAASHTKTPVDKAYGWSKITASGRQETSHMSISTNLDELAQRHRALEDEITEALHHPSSDGLLIAELKRRKLQVKDEIMRLMQDTGVNVSLH
jgi:hypothetical protein